MLTKMLPTHLDILYWWLDISSGPMMLTLSPSEKVELLCRNGAIHPLFSMRMITLTWRNKVYKDLLGFYSRGMTGVPACSSNLWESDGPAVSEVARRKAQYQHSWLCSGTNTKLLAWYPAQYSSKTCELVEFRWLVGIHSEDGFRKSASRENSEPCPDGERPLRLQFSLLLDTLPGFLPIPGLFPERISPQLPSVPFTKSLEQVTAS